MYQNYQQNAFQNQMGSSGGSQYRGLETKYQPVGNVQSQYNQSLGMNGQMGYQNANQNTNFQGQYLGQSQQQQYGSYPSTEAFHTANYRGNQQGHDQGLRGDSLTPAQQQGGAGYETDYSSFRYGIRGNENAYSNINDTSSQFGFSNPYSGMNNQMSSRSSFGQGNQGNQGYGASAGFSSNGQNSYAQNPAAEAFHMANYRGNQEGHDQGLRGDSFSPAQQQGGIANSNTNYGSFRYGVRGNESASNNINNVAPQFGMNSGAYNMSGQSSFR